MDGLANVWLLLQIRFRTSTFGEASVLRLQLDPSSPIGDFAEGVRAALDQLTRHSKEHLAVLLVFTQGPINVDAAASVIAEHNKRSLSITGRPVSVFLYGVDIQDEATFANMTKLAELVNGIARNIGLADPLLGIYAYFDYLARSFVGHPPTWARLYADAFRKAEVTTLMKHVFDPQGRVLGIVGLDLKSPSVAQQIVGNNTKAPPPISVFNPRDTLQLPSCTTPCEDSQPSFTCGGAESKQPLETNDVLCPKVTLKDAESRVCCGASCFEQNSAGRVWKCCVRENFMLQIAVTLVVITLLSKPGPFLRRQHLIDGGGYQ